MRIQEIGSTREQADAFYQRLVENTKQGDANNRLYQIESTVDYDPSPGLEKIRAKLFAIDFADDAVNPPELGALEAGVARIPGGALRGAAGHAAIARPSVVDARGAVEGPSGGILEVHLTGLPAAVPRHPTHAGERSMG